MIAVSTVRGPEQAVETEVAGFLGRYADLKTEAGHGASCATVIARTRDHDRHRSCGRAPPTGRCERRINRIFSVLFKLILEPEE